jgi:hypothetical protein
MQRKFQEMLLERSGEERLKMGCSMHAAARALVKASISEKDPIAVNRVLFLRFYGGEFEPKERKKILLAMRNAVKHKGKQKSKAKEEAKKNFRS